MRKKYKETKSLLDELDHSCLLHSLYYYGRNDESQLEKFQVGLWLYDITYILCDNGMSFFN